NGKTGWTGVGAWLGVFAILLLQVEFAAHAQSEHELPLEADSHCEICLKLDSSGNAPVSAASSLALPDSATALRQPALMPLKAATEYSLPARGPPAA
ncbi:MAG: hypothetical protein AAGE85_12865, partial [Pseudomonadota bacterium]